MYMYSIVYNKNIFSGKFAFLFFLNESQKYKLSWAKEGKDIDNKYLKDNKINIYPYWNINKKDTTIEGWFPDEQIHWFARDINKNEIGCALGHINMWKEAQQNEDDIAIFMEDDCWFSKNWQLYLRVALD